MKKDEKTKLTRQKIIHAAIEEFGTKNYDGASVNAICAHNKISKGLIYHNFKNKDELYLECVKICYQQLMENLKNVPYSSLDFHERLKMLMDTRQIFFEENPHFAQIFFNSILNPPKHLLKELKMLRNDYDHYLKQRYTELLKNVQLKPAVSLEKAVQYFLIFQEMYNSYFRNLHSENQDMYTLIEMHETKISELLNVILYGISCQKENFEDTCC